MQSPPIVFDHIWKRYMIGTHHDSLRDAIPSLLKRLINGNGHRGNEGEFWALSDVSFTVRKGENLGIVGPNGAGKSTILKLLSRITRQTRGTLKVRGRLAALIELGGGFHQDLTGAENIYLQGTMLGFSRKQVARLYDSIVAFSELEAFLNTPVKRYSSGMVVRQGFAIAAQLEPDVLLLDEVLAVGDLAFQQKCFRRFDELRARGTTMIFISHNLEAVQKLCDRVLLLQEERVVGEGEPTEMIRRYRNEVLGGLLKAETAAPAMQANGPLHIREVTLRDAEGAEIESIETGQPVRIEVAYEAARPIAHPVFRIGLERLDGLLCHSTSSAGRNGLLPKELTGSGSLTLEYPALNLLPNLYQVTVEVFEGSNPVPVASLRQQRYFQTTSDHAEHGAVHMEHAWMFGR